MGFIVSQVFQYHLLRVLYYCLHFPTFVVEEGIRYVYSNLQEEVEKCTPLLEERY